MDKIMNRIFVLVYVWFDHHRFQTNQYAHTDKTKLYDYVAKHNSNNLPVVEYKEPYDDVEILGEEVEHFWIQTID